MTDQLAVGPARSTDADLFDGVLVLIRRWYVVLPILVVAAVISFNIYVDKDVSYTDSTVMSIKTTSVAIEFPEKTDRPVVSRTNSLVDSGGVTLIANLLLIRLRSSGSAPELADSVPGASLSVDILSRPANLGQLPALQVSVTAGSAQKAREALPVARKLVRTAILDVQRDAGVPDEQLATTYLLRGESGPQRVEVSRTRPAASVALAGVVLAVVVAALVEAVGKRRRRRSLHAASGTKSSA